MLTTRYTIDDLTTASVSIKIQRYYEALPLGEHNRKSYVNSVRGRQELKEEVPTAQVNAVFAVWGDEPIVDDTASE